MQQEGMQATRLYFLGDQALAEGFALIGFDTLPNATAEDLDRLLDGLRRDRTNAFVVIDKALAERGSQLLPKVNAEGGRIVVAEVPALASPEDFRLAIDDQIELLLGGEKLED